MRVLSPFRDRLAAGCRTEPECRALQAQAEARVAECESSCKDAEADLVTARSYVEVFDRQHAEWRYRQAQQQEALRRAHEAQVRAAADLGF